MDEETVPIGLISLLTFIMLIIMFEIFHRRANYKSDMKMDTSEEAPT